jgi:hypothetical protein
MRLFIYQGTVFHRTYNRVGDALWDPPLEPALDLASADHGVPAGEIMVYATTDPAEAEALLNAPLAALVPTLADGQVVSVAVDPAWTPPAPPPDPLAELKQIVDQNILASEHDRRWLAQKEAAKRLGIPWIKGHPAASQAEAEEALTTLLAAEFPGEPLVASPAGVILSYAKAAQARGYIPDPSFTALRDLVAAAPEAQLTKLLAKL